MEKTLQEYKVEDKPTIQASIKLADSERGSKAVDSFFEDLVVLIKERASE